MSDTPRRVRAVLHAKANTPEVRSALDGLVARGVAVDAVVTAGPGDAARLAAEAAALGFDAVVAGGGDGTLHEVVNGLAAGRALACSLALLPLGTANDFARAANVPADPAEALALLDRPAVPIDLGRADGRLFVNVASGGFPTEITTSTPPELKNALGGVAYLLNGLASLDRIEARPVRLHGPDLDWDGRAFVLAVGNGQSAGGGFRVCDRALLDDGLLDLFVLPEVPLADLPALAADLVSSSSAGYARAVYRQVPWLEVDAPDGLQFNLDGEPLTGTRFRFEAVPAAVRFHLPADAPLRGRGPNRAAAPEGQDSRRGSGPPGV